MEVYTELNNTHPTRVAGVGTEKKVGAGRAEITAHKKMVPLSR